jgi:hypothetical protein
MYSPCRGGFRGKNSLYEAIAKYLMQYEEQEISHYPSWGVLLTLERACSSPVNIREKCILVATL